MYLNRLPLLLFFQDEINAQDENIEHFHKKLMEIQEMLQSHEAPLELQVRPAIILLAIIIF